MTLNHLAALPWAGRNYALGMLRLFDQFKQLSLAPQRYGTSERRTFALGANLDKFLSLWEQHHFTVLKSPNPWDMTVVVTMDSPGVMYPTGISHVSVHIKEGFFELDSRTESFLKLAQALYLWGQIDYGCIYSGDEHKEKNIVIHGPATWYGGGRLDQMLPGIYWANFFGPRYVHWFGDEKFEKLPAFHKEQLTDGGWLILTRASPLSARGIEVRTLERTIIHHLGEDAFFDKDHPDRPTIAPPFVQQRRSG